MLNHHLLGCCSGSVQISTFCIIPTVENRDDNNDIYIYIKDAHNNRIFFPPRNGFNQIFFNIFFGRVGQSYAAKIGDANNFFFV